jgi:hypothetical protein
MTVPLEEGQPGGEVQGALHAPCDKIGRRICDIVRCSIDCERTSLGCVYLSHVARARVVMTLW